MRQLGSQRPGCLQWQARSHCPSCCWLVGNLRRFPLSRTAPRGGRPPGTHWCRCGHPCWSQCSGQGHRYRRLWCPSSYGSWTASKSVWTHPVRWTLTREREVIQLVSLVFQVHFPLTFLKEHLLSSTNYYSPYKKFSFSGSWLFSAQALSYIDCWYWKHFSGFCHL